MVKYQEYITSKDWRGKHKDWLRQANYKCAFTLLPVGKKGQSYNMHHTDYINLGNESYGDDVLVSSKWFHNWVIHGILSGFKSAGKQKGCYPNRAQRLVHSWGRLPYQVKKFTLIAIAATLTTAPIAILTAPGKEEVRPAWGTASQFVIRAAHHRVSKL